MMHARTIQWYSSAFEFLAPHLHTTWLCVPHTLSVVSRLPHAVQAPSQCITVVPYASHTNLPKVDDVDPVCQRECQCQLALRMVDGPAPKPVFDMQAKFAKLAASKSGRVYMPSVCLCMLQAQAGQDKMSPEYQHLLWDVLWKLITGIVNRVNVTNIKHVVPELFSENLIRGRGLFAQSVMKVQAVSLPYTPVFAALVSIINMKLPQVGELLLHRLISQFRKSFKQNDKVCCALCPLPASWL